MRIGAVELSKFALANGICKEWAVANRITIQ